MRQSSKLSRGFTIVELLIVIVIIAILAALVIIAYQGIQNRATNTKTTNALNSWVQAFHAYRADNSKWPNAIVCLGEGYGKGLSGDEASGYHCRQTAAGTGINESASFVNTMKVYLGNKVPSPSFVTASATSTNWRRGLTYYYGGGGDGTLVYIEAAYAGSLSQCPNVKGLPTTIASWNGNTNCRYDLGVISDT